MTKSLIHSAVVAAIIALAVQVGCANAGQQKDPEALMQSGLDALYTRHDPTAAVAAFRKVLAQNPTHYGATFQLAKALDAAGKKDEARVVWEKVLLMAETIKDEGTADTARVRLGKPTRQDVAMTAGLDALYKQRDANAAVAEFRKVLALNPNHYGANFQLAKALDAAGQTDAARAQWEKVLPMAEAAKDQAIHRRRPRPPGGADVSRQTGP